LVGAGWVTPKVNGNRVGLIRKFLVTRRGVDAISTAQIFSNRFEQSALQNLGHRAEAHSMHLVILKWSAKDYGRRALGLDTFLNFFHDHIIGRAHAHVLPALLALNRRQRSQIS